MDTLLLEQEMVKENHNRDYVELCVSYADSLKNNGYPIIFDIGHFALLVGVKSNEIYSYYVLANKLYKKANIPKKNGEFREISVPSENLKFIQRWILDNVLYRAEVNPHVNGFMRNKSIVDNAIKHVGKDCVINLDIKDFFPSIAYTKVYNLFISFGYTSHLAIVFAGLCTYNKVLPQGAPTSPFISNLVCEKLDLRMDQLAKKIGASYTRYADRKSVV